MKTFQDFVSESYGKKVTKRPLVRGRDYEDFKGLKPLPDFNEFQGGRKKDPKKEKRADTVRRMNAAGKKLGLPEEHQSLEELFITRKSKQKSKEDKKSELMRLIKHAQDPYADTTVKKRNEEYVDEGIGMTVASALGNPPLLSKRMKLKRALIVNNIKREAEKNKDKKYSGKASTQKEDYDLNETSLTRVMRKSQKGGMAIMSAQRGDKSKKENKARSKQLEKDIRGAGLPGPTKVSGRYTENPGTPDEKKVGEKSHVISSGKKGKRKFKKAIEKLGKKYNQDSVLLQRKGGGSATLKGTSKTSWPGQGKNVKIGKMKPGRTGEFDTRVKNKTFTVEH